MEKPPASTQDQVPFFRLALAPPHAARGCLVCITSPDLHRPLAGQLVNGGGEGALCRTGFYLTAPFSDVAEVMGKGGAAFSSLFQTRLVPRWRWQVLEGCATPADAADRLLAIVIGRDESWAQYQKGLLAEIIAAKWGGRPNLLTLDNILAWTRSAVQKALHHPLLPLLPRWSRLALSIPAGFELEMVPTLRAGGSVIAFMDALASSYEDTASCLLDVLAACMPQAALEEARMAFRSADVVLLTGFDLG
ncbi:MAG TPA: hypothetical protein PLN91_00820 [Rhodanobacteraceae bacterium]|nr:hypothetical protein [Rhodanobacteraceae bacterium]